ncbi:MAG TPA: NADPH-dependent FMN reductase [Pseudolysinimonas sp.]|jgi:NAD(P)H-dependent FMN reductase
MPIRLMIIVGSVRPGRIGLPIATWVRERAEAHGGFEIDFVDLAELNLPFMDEPNHPSLHQYTHEHTIAWGERVSAADAFLFVTPEYNHSYSPALKNALDFLNREWWRKPLGFVSYGGVAGGTRGVVALTTVTSGLGLVKIGANVELNFAKAQVVDGVFVPKEKESAILEKELGELIELSEALMPSRLKG